MRDEKRTTDFEALPLYLTVPQLASVLGIGKNTAYGIVSAGAISSIRIGRQIRIPKDALKSFKTIV